MYATGFNAVNLPSGAAFTAFALGAAKLFEIEQIVQKHAAKTRINITFSRIFLSMLSLLFNQIKIYKLFAATYKACF